MSWYLEKLLIGSLQNKLKTLFKHGSFPLCYGHFLRKNCSKMLSEGPNTMKETWHCPGILGKGSYRQSSASNVAISVSNVAISTELWLAF